GGLILINRTVNHLTRRAEPYALAAFLNRMQKAAPLPLLVAGDFERGASMRVDSTTLFPHAMAFAATGDPKTTRYAGQITAQEARAFGVHWVLYPVADVNNNPDNPIINIRSYGENPEAVAAHVRAFIKGARDNPRLRVLTTAKHFPGHGDTSVDSHMSLSTINSDKAHLDSVEFVPFRAAIAEKVDSIMTAHIAVPAIEAPEIPATISTVILTNLLKKELAFHGLVVTDALEMGGIAKGFATGEAAVRAIEAGADVLLMPPDPDAAIRAVVAAVRKGRLTEKRVEESLLKVLNAKLTVGLDKSRLVDVEAIADQVNSPEAAEKAQEIADRAVTLIRNEGNLVPVRAGPKTCFLVLAESRYTPQGQAMLQEIRTRAPQSRAIAFDGSMTDLELDEAGRQTDECEQFVVAAFVTTGAYRGNLSLPGGLPKLMDGLVATGRPMTLVALGSPYLIRSYPKVSAYLTTYSPVLTAEIAAVKALFGDIRIGGHLPVTIPDIAKYGDGLTVEPPTARPRIVK
ncbi:MAG: glycoside hydrolase family 3 N-terminal domain-containing protein, partial [Bryobacteraceae bacterium]